MPPSTPKPMQLNHEVADIRLVLEENAKLLTYAVEVYRAVRQRAVTSPGNRYWIELVGHLHSQQVRLHARLAQLRSDSAHLALKRKQDELDAVIAKTDAEISRLNDELYKDGRIDSDEEEVVVVKKGKKRDPDAQLLEDAIKKLAPIGDEMKKKKQQMEKRQRMGDNGDSTNGGGDGGQMAPPLASSTPNDSGLEEEAKEEEEEEEGDDANTSPKDPLAVRDLLMAQMHELFSERNITALSLQNLLSPVEGMIKVSSFFTGYTPPATEEKGDNIKA